MAPRKKAGETSPGAVVKRDSSAPGSSSKLPNALRFPLVAVLNLSLSGILYSLSAEFVSGDLADVSRRHDEWWEIGALAGVKIVELGVSWFGGYDSYDLASLTLLTHFPVHYLLTTFYGVRPLTLLASLGIDIFSIALPVHILRPLSASHSPATHPKSSVANRLILSDPVTAAATSLSAAGIYACTLLLAYRSSLTVSLATHFDGLRTLEPAHSAPFFGILLWLLPLGFAAKTFLFVPATGAKPDEQDAKRRHFRAATASLYETAVWNFWGWSRRERELIKRTAVLVGMTAVCVGVKTLATVQGSEALGALSWAAVWSGAAVATGLAFWWVGGVEDIKG